MYYFGTNLDTRFHVPDFWPKPEETHKIPFEKEDQVELAKRLKEIRLEKRRRRLEREGLVGGEKVESSAQIALPEKVDEVSKPEGSVSDRGFGKGVIERWARGE